MRIKRHDVLSALGFNGFADNELLAQIDSALRYLEDVTPKFESLICDLDFRQDGKIYIADTDNELVGRGLVKLLNGCQKALIYASTLGTTVDKAINIARFSSKNRALVLDAAADAYLNDFTKQKTDEIKESLSPLFMTELFTAAYGDFSLHVQPIILSALDAQSKLGIGISGNLLLTPRKSQTGVAGITDNEQIAQYGKCLLCKNANCRLRFKGQKCV